MNRAEIILIVDDDSASRDTVEALLLPLGWTMAFASDGAEALLKASQIQPDLILLDVMMPGLDGFEVCRRLRADPQLTEVPVILITALDDAGSRLAGIEAGADDFVSKPYDRATLRARVTNTLKLNRYRRLLVERSRFEWVVQNSDDGYLTLDADDRIVYANPRASQFLGLPGDLVALPAEGFLALVRKKYTLQPQEAWAAWPGELSAILLTTRYLIQQASTMARAFWLQVDVLDTPVTPDHQMLVRLRDVTASLTLTRDMWAFDSIVLHKLNTPLSPIVVGLELLEPEVLASLSADGAQLLAGALRQARRLQSEIADITQYLHLPAERVFGKGIAVADLRALIEGAGAELGLASIAISVESGCEDTCLPISAVAIDLIVRELLENAQKFHPARSPCVDVQVRRLTSGEVRIRVADDGIWCPGGKLARLWIPYYQGESSFTGNIPGMGLGLAMVRSLVWEFGGRCSVRNRDQMPGIVVDLVFAG